MKVGIIGCTGSKGAPSATSLGKFAYGDTITPPTTGGTLVFFYYHSTGNAPNWANNSTYDGAATTQQFVSTTTRAQIRIHTAPAGSGGVITWAADGIVTGPNYVGFDLYVYHVPEDNAVVGATASITTAPDSSGLWYLPFGTSKSSDLVLLSYTIRSTSVGNAYTTNLPLIVDDVMPGTGEAGTTLFASGVTTSAGTLFSGTQTPPYTAGGYFVCAAIALRIA